MSQRSALFFRWILRIALGVVVVSVVVFCILKATEYQRLYWSLGITEGTVLETVDDSLHHSNITTDIVLGKNRDGETGLWELTRDQNGSWTGRACGTVTEEGQVVFASAVRIVGYLFDKEPERDFTVQRIYIYYVYGEDAEEPWKINEEMVPPNCSAVLSQDGSCYRIRFETSDIDRANRFAEMFRSMVVPA